MKAIKKVSLQAIETQKNDCSCGVPCNEFDMLGLSIDFIYDYIAVKTQCPNCHRSFEFELGSIDHQTKIMVNHYE